LSEQPTRATAINAGIARFIIPLRPIGGNGEQSANRPKRLARLSAACVLFPWHIRAMPDKSISERLDDCEKFQADLQSELVSHSGRLDDLSKRIEVQEEATKQF